MDHHCQVTAIVQNHIERFAVWEEDSLFDAPIEFFSSHTLPCVHGNASDRDRGCRVILCRKDVAAGPLHFRPERRERLDEHSSLNRHVQAPSNSGPFERLCFAIFFAEGHQPRHLDFGNFNFFTPQLSQF